MDRATKGGWIYIMADGYRGTIYVGVTADLALRVSQHRADTGSEFCRRYGLKRLVWAEHFDRIEDAIAQEKRVKHGATGNVATTSSPVSSTGRRGWKA